MSSKEHQICDGSENGQSNRNIHVTTSSKMIILFFAPRVDSIFCPRPSQAASSLSEVKARPKNNRHVERRRQDWRCLQVEMGCLWLKLWFSNFGSLWSWHLVLVSSKEGVFNWTMVKLSRWSRFLRSSALSKKPVWQDELKHGRVGAVSRNETRTKPTDK